MSGYFMLEVPFDISFASHWWTFDFKTCQKEAVVESVSSRIDYFDATNHDRGLLLVRDKGNANEPRHLQTVLVVRGERGLFEIPDEAGKLVGSFRAQGHGWYVFLLRPAKQESSRRLPHAEALKPVELAPTVSSPKGPPTSSGAKPPEPASPPPSESVDPFEGLL